METEQSGDPIDPDHYQTYDGFEVIDITEQLNFNRGNAVKYIMRAGLKHEETETIDLMKAKWYIEREIERLQKETVRSHIHVFTVLEDTPKEWDGELKE